MYCRFASRLLFMSKGVTIQGDNHLRRQERPLPVGMPQAREPAFSLRFKTDSELGVLLKIRVFEGFPDGGAVVLLQINSAPVHAQNKSRGSGDDRRPSVSARRTAVVNQSCRGSVHRIILFQPY